MRAALQKDANRNLIDESDLRSPLQHQYETNLIIIIITIISRDYSNVVLTAALYAKIHSTANYRKQHARICMSNCNNHLQFAFHGMVDDFSFFDCSSHFFLLIEFHYTFSIPCEIAYYVYNCCIVIR